MRKKSLNYFAYGSNMFTYRLEKRVGKVEVIGVGRLSKYLLLFNKTSVDGSLKANITYTGKIKDEVIGIVFKINQTRKKDLDKAEGLGKGYDIKRIEIALEGTDDRVKAFTYASKEIKDIGANRPYDWYMEFIKSGAQEHNLPAGYREKLNAVATKEDENIGRRDVNLFLLKESKAIRKSITQSLEWIFELNKAREFKISLPSHALDKRKILIEKADRGFRFQTNSIIPKGVQRHKELQVSGRTLSLKGKASKPMFFVEGKDFLLSNISYDFDKGLKLLSGSINSIGSGTQTELNNRYLRLIIPIQKKLKLFNDYQSIGFVIDYKLYSGLLPLTINEKGYHFFEVKQEQKLYLFIDCLEKATLAEFQNRCQAILLTYAFLSGDFHATEGYFLAFENNQFQAPEQILYHTFSESRYDLNAAYTTNPYTGIDLENLKRDEKGFIDEKTRKEMYADLIFFPVKVFNEICEVALANEKVFRALLLLIFNQSSSLEMKIPIQYVAIEALTGAIIKKGNAELKPIENKDLANKLVSILRNETESFLVTNNIKVEGNELLTPLFRRLETINAPTNTDKLSKPFNVLGYSISEEERSFLKLRDTFLHGSIKSFGTSDDDFKGLFYLSLKLHFLICVLLLKRAGFGGRIINYPKLYEHITEKYLEEEVLRMI